MLVLKRRRDEAIDIRLGPLALTRIVVLRIDQNSVQLGIAAPQEVKILRGELSERAKTRADGWLPSD